MKYLLTFLLIISSANLFAQSRPAIKNIATTNVRCSGQANGSITITATNGIPPYNFSIDGGRSFQESNIFGQLKPATYMVIIRDARQQFSDSQSAVITEPERLILRCSGSIQCGNSGTVTVDAAGGTQPYTYSWNAGTSTSSETQTGLPPGIYVATVFDANQCSDTCSIILTQQGGSSAPKYKVGDSISCGYIFYVDPNADSAHPCDTHYLVCSKADQGKTVTWFNPVFTYTVTNATTDILFDRANAIKIDSFSLAASTCSAFSTDSCSGWYLPSKTELDTLYTNLAAKGIGNFAKEGYWSSVEGTKKHAAWIVDFLNGLDIQNDKSNKYHVRAICEVWLPNN